MRLRILQWNVWFKENADNIVRQLRDIDADVMCLQELTTNSEYNPSVDVPKKIAHELSLHCVYHEAQRWAGAPVYRDQGNGIFSKFPIQSTRHVYVQNPIDRPRGPADEGRVYVEASVSLGDNSTLTLGTTHLSYTPRFALTPLKRVEVDRLLRTVSSHC